LSDVAIETAKPSGFTGPEKAEYRDYVRCVHCGLCLNHCPTYRLWGREADSPRGRIRQMFLVDRGEMPLDATFVSHIDRCLDCRACETACPSGVEYGKLVELARGQIQKNFQRPARARLLRDFFYRRVLTHRGRLTLLARSIRFYQRSGLEGIANATGLLRLLGMESRAKLMPPIDRHFFSTQTKKVYPATGTRRARVALFAGCVARMTFTELNEATIRVLRANGCEVVVPADQWCCGALAVHAGYRDVARDLARRNLDIFLAEDYDAILTNAAGCGSTLKEYALLFPAGDENHERAKAFDGRVKDVTEFLDGLGLVAPLRPLAMRATYQDSCHLLHGQKIRQAPRRLIGAVPGLELVEMKLPDQCCGSAGVYNITETDTAMDLLEKKMEDVRSTGADTILTANPGCILQLRAGTRLASTGQQVLHVVELLDRALKTD
jgi:glycolate dehydrogenase iron-sulfur subunit